MRRQRATAAVPPALAWCRSLGVTTLPTAMPRGEGFAPKQGGCPSHPRDGAVGDSRPTRPPFAGAPPQALARSGGRAALHTRRPPPARRRRAPSPTAAVVRRRVDGDEDPPQSPRGLLLRGDTRPFLATSVWPINDHAPAAIPCDDVCGGDVRHGRGPLAPAPFAAAAGGARPVPRPSPRPRGRERRSSQRHLAFVVDWPSPRPLPPCRRARGGSASPAAAAAATGRA